MKIKKILVSVLMAALAALLVFLTACAPSDHEKTELLNVVLAENEHISCDISVNTIERGGSAEFEFLTENGYIFDRVNYDDTDVKISEPNSDGTRAIKLKVNNVKYSAYLEVKLRQAAKIFKVNIAASDVFVAVCSELSVKEHATATFELLFEKKYTAAAVDYDGEYSFTGVNSMPDKDGKRHVILTLNDVKSDMTLNISARETSAGDVLYPARNLATVGYSLNGGQFIDRNREGEFYRVNYRLSTHPRPNTSIGTDTIKRDGYVLLGWNTTADGSGDHIGLGSRVSVKRNETLMLYAEWAKEDAADRMDYVEVNADDLEDLYEAKDKAAKLDELILRDSVGERCAVLTKYYGSSRRIVIPRYIDGLRVAAVMSGFHSGDRILRTVVFSDAITYIAANAFTDCVNLTELYISDNLYHIDAEAFGNADQIRTLHINAVLPPVYGDTENGQVCNKIEMLINADPKEKKAVFFGSCSLWYGMDSEIVYNAINAKYRVYNMGVIGGTCALHQVDLINMYMNDGDVFADIAEAGSLWQLFADLSFDSRVYVGLENNYDLLSMLDLRRYTNVMGALDAYLYDKTVLFKREERGSYEDYLAYMSPYGDNHKLRVGVLENNGEMYELNTADVVEKTNAFDVMRELFTEMTERNITVLYGFGPINIQSVELEEIRALDVLFKRKLAELPVKQISSIEENLLKKYDFFDTNYHLSNNGSKIWSNLLADKVRAVL